MSKSQGPRRTSTKEATDRKQPYIKEQKEPVSLNVMKVLADPYPMRGEEYAVQLFYRSKEGRRNPFFKCWDARMEDDNETAHLHINDANYKVNIRTGKVEKSN